MEEHSLYRKTLKRMLTKSWMWIWLLLLAAGAILLLGINRFTLEIQLKGDGQVFWEYGTPFADPGGEAVMYGTLLCKGGFKIPGAEVVMQDPGSLDTLGRHSVMYKASFLGWEAEAERTVCVIDTVSPVISVSRVLADHQPPDDYDPMRGITATDNYDGDITDRVVWSVTTGWITYSVIDSSGNPTYIVREADIVPSQPPEIVLEGGEQYAVTVGSFYEEPGYTASDSADGDLTQQVVTEGEVDWLTPGTYPVTYTVTDSGGNVTSVTRQVYVESMPRPRTQWPNTKTIYLTFDDGPGPYTRQLLGVLEQYGVKATFFVTDSDHNSVMKEIVEQGHSIGIHSVTHDYEEVYASPEAYFRDLWNMQEIIYQNTGVYTTLVRFPGGSSNLISGEYCEGLMTILTEAVQNAGFQYFDWNVDSDDAATADDSKTVRDNVIGGIIREGTSVVLQHDIHGYSVEAVEEIIQWGLENGYTFRPLTDTSPGFHHEVRN